MSGQFPIVEEILPMPDAEAVFVQLAMEPHCLFLDSALRHERQGRYSFIAVDPFRWIKIAAPRDRVLSPAGRCDEFSEVQQVLKEFSCETIEGLPPFQGGVAGLFSYDLHRSLERVQPPVFDEFHVPGLAVGCYDTVLSFDHVQQRCWIVSQGFPEREPGRRAQRARERAADLRQRLEHPDPRAEDSGASDLRGEAASCGTESGEGADLAESDLAPLFDIPAAADFGRRLVRSSFSQEQYLRMVRRAVDFIYAGDIFQVNLSQRLLHPAQGSSLALYRRLRRRNPAPFAGYLDLGAFQIASASPERFVQVVDGIIEARPIKGTRPRRQLPEADLFAGGELQESDKDRAENVMILDLLRNDLSKVCLPESVRVTELCQLEIYQFVQHLVSAVQGTLRADIGCVDILRAAFPGGSITGAPKVRAMEIIAELEPTARGPYCGSLGYLGFNGAMDLSILIRTVTAGRGWWQFPVGGGIVAQSDPAAEYMETWHKARGILQSLS